MYSVSIHKKAIKYYESLNDKTVKKINKAIEEISEHPFEGPHIKKMRGNYEGKYRYATGDLRLVYRINAESEVVLIEAIGSRGDVYK
jgi:mRNA interferase RelE/StbE